MAAKDDALASCSEDAVDETAYYCAGRAAYKLIAYTESQTYFQNALKLNPSDLRYKKELKWATSRIWEREDGFYAFNSMVISITEQSVLSY